MLGSSPSMTVKEAISRFFHARVFSGSPIHKPAPIRYRRAIPPVLLWLADLGGYFLMHANKFGLYRFFIKENIFCWIFRMYR